MKVPNVILIKPPEISSFDFGAFSLATLAAYISDISNVKIIDATFDSVAVAAKKVWSFQPDLIGITVMSITSIPSAKAFIKELISQNNGAKARILVGGHGVFNLQEEFITAGVDAVISGEGEMALRSVILNGIIPHSPGLTCLSGAKIIKGPRANLIYPLDNLPSPARHLIAAPRDGVYLMETSRGCPHSCKFCETSEFYGHRWRPYSAERVAKEVASLVEEFDAFSIMFADDNFAADTARVFEICKRLKKGRLPAVFFASVRADDLLRKPELVQEMARANILRVSVGVETVEPQLAEKIGKTTSLNEYKEVFNLLRRFNIFSLASFITGLPGQEIDSETTVSLAVEMKPDAAVFVPFHPMPGTELANGKIEYKPKDEDVANAKEMNLNFFKNTRVINNLSNAQSGGGIRSILARAILEKVSG